MKKVLTIGLAALMCGAALAGCGGAKDPATDGGAKETVTEKAGGKTETFTWWLGQGEDSSYFPTYQENPGIQYLMTKTWGPNDTKLSLEFLIPVAGAQQDNFNTMLATGDCADVMDVGYYSGSIAELYQSGTILDLTEYVEKYMPNYRAFLDAHPDVKKTATNAVNGEKKYLQLWGYRDALGDAWGGYMYRRDWLIKYGVNPVDGSAFSGAYTETNPDGSPNNETWADNVVFPSGGSDPVYISDWEWMLDIFSKAIADQSISDGYCMSLYYPGFVETGDLVCAFGGGGSTWYKTPEDKIAFGATGDNFRTYLECMNAWYKNGWIDKAFAEHATDMFFAVDDTKVRQGKVGLWYGLQSQLEGKLDTGEGLLDGIVVYAARQPINDVYGGAAQQGVEPYCMYQQAWEAGSTCVSGKAKDKDLAALFALYDYLYSPEGCILKAYGLNKEQFEVTQNELYKKYGLTEGAYTVIETDAGLKYKQVDSVLNDQGTLKDAVRPWRLSALDPISIGVDAYAGSMMNNIRQWTWYVNTGLLEKSFTGQLTPEEQQAFSKVETNVREFLSKNVPNFIKGAKDPYSDADWNAFVKAVGKYNPDSNSKIYQNLLDTLK